MAQRLGHILSFPLRWGALLLLLGVLIPSFPAVQSQSDLRYFPETGHYLRGAFRVFWENNGGIEIFGFPLTEEYIAANGRITQYFERARFEYTIDVNGQPFIELGRLGVEYTQGRVFPKVPPIQNTAQRRYIPETGHIIQYGFKEIWETRGGERIFGFPISEEIYEVLENGRWHTVQYFERARFEYWPERAPGQRVIISSLGRALVPPELTPPLPPDVIPGAPAPIGTPPQPPQPPQLPPPPEPEEPPVPPGVNARVIPESGPRGTTFVLDARGFSPRENVGIWLTAPDQSTFGADFQVRADDQGSIGYARIEITTNQDFQSGIWSFNAQGVRSGNQAIGYFRINRTGGVVGDASRLGVVAHDELSIQGQAFIVPVAAPPGTPFRLQASGFAPGERVSSWITGPDGTSTPIRDSAVQVDEGFVQVDFGTGGLSNGFYTAVAQGHNTAVIGAASFKLTNDYVAGPGTPRPDSVNGRVTPAEGGPGTVFQLRGQNLQSNELVELWITDPTGVYVLFPDRGLADGEGRIGYEPPLDLEVSNDLPPGVYGIHFRGMFSGTRVSLYFTVVGTSAGRVPTSGTRLHFVQQLSGKGFGTPVLP